MHEKGESRIGSRDLRIVQSGPVHASMTGPMQALDRPHIPAIVSQHVEEAAHLRHVRSVLVRAPHVRLHQLRRLDDRIAAHLDGIAVAGGYGLKLCTQALATPAVGVVFALAVRALELRDGERLQSLLAVATALPEVRAGVLSAFGWVSAQVLQGTIRDLLRSDDPERRIAGLAACAMHGVDPGAVLIDGLASSDAATRLRALTVAAQVGRLDLLAVVSAVACAERPGPDGAVAAMSAVLLGDRGVALRRLAGLLDGGGERVVTPADASALYLKACDLPSAHTHLRALAAQGAVPAVLRRLVRDCGTVGDPHFVPWLISLMADDRWARLAGEAFTLISGADLAALDLERKPPEGVGDGVYGGPSDDPADDDVAMDEDDSLPWPDAARVQAWWAAQQARFPAGRRFFMGAEPSPAQALSVLKQGCQRQRAAAAQWRCLLAPGTALFPTRAPAWRQQRWLVALA
jgi:uncharacterized protein (TIGR02270 family)